MRAVARDTYCQPEALRLVELPTPVPGEGEVLIRVRATALNASDIELLTGKPLYGRVFGPLRPRFGILGSDVAGTVEAVGPGVTQLRVGDAVYGDIFEHFGGLAEAVCAPATALRPKPAAMSFEQAAALPQSGAIALQGICDEGRLEAGERVLVNGAGGGGGSFAVQLAKRLGAEVTAVDGPHKLDLLLSLGADHVIDHTRQDCTRGAQRYDLILDLVGHHSVVDFWRALAPGGRYLLVGGPMRLVFGVLGLGTLLTLLTSKKVGMLALKTNHGLDRLEDLFQAGELKPAIDRYFPLPQASEALRYLADGRALGKVVITVASD